MKTNLKTKYALYILKDALPRWDDMEEYTKFEMFRILISNNRVKDLKALYKWLVWDTKTNDMVPYIGDEDTLLICYTSSIR